MKNNVSLTNTVNQSNALSQKLQYHDKLSVLTAQEKLIIFFLASYIDPQDNSFRDVCLPMKQFCDILDINLCGGKQRKLLEDSLYRLSHKGFWVVSNGGKRKEIGRWISKGVIDYEKGEIILRLDDSLRPFFLNLRDSARTIFQLGYTVRFKKKHTCDLYALCKSAAGLKYWNIPYNELQGLLGGGYSRYYNLEQRVLRPCLLEINLLSDIMVEYKPIKKNNHVIAICFKIRNKTKQEKKNMGLEYQKFNKGKEIYDHFYVAAELFPELTRIQQEDDVNRSNAQDKVKKDCILERVYN